MTFAGNVRVLDLEDTSALAQAYAVECEATRQARPGWVPLGEGARIAAWRGDSGWVHEPVGAYEGDHLVGVASSATAHDSPETSWVFVSVLPRHQRRGVGTRLVREVEDRRAGRVRRFVADAYRPTAEDLAALATGFAGPLGYAVATTETVVELDLVGADLSPLRPPDGYVVSTHVDGVPDHLRPQVGVLKGLVDAEAPHGDLAWQPAPVSPQAYQDEISLWRTQRRMAVESVAVTARGEVVAWTCVVVAPDPARPAQIQGTIVLAPHRGLRLGATVKIASLLAVRDLGIATHVRTSSDDRNVWMRAVNEDLGFVPVESELLLQKHVQRETGVLRDPGNELNRWRLGSPAVQQEER